MRDRGISSYPILFFPSCSTLKSPILPVSRNLHCHPPKVPGFFHSFTMNAYRTCHHSWTLPGLITSLCPLEVPEAPDSQYTAAGQPLATGVPDGAGGRKEVEQKMWGKIPVLGWDLGGSGGGSCHGHILNFFHWNTTYFPPKCKLQMAVTIYSKVSWLCFTLKNVCVLKSTESVPIRGHWRLKANHSK